MHGLSGKGKKKMSKKDTLKIFLIGLSDYQINLRIARCLDGLKLSDKDTAIDCYREAENGAVQSWSLDGSEEWEEPINYCVGFTSLAKLLDEGGIMLSSNGCIVGLTWQHLYTHIEATDKDLVRKAAEFFLLTKYETERLKNGN